MEAVRLRDFMAYCLANDFYGSISVMSAVKEACERIMDGYIAKSQYEEFLMMERDAKLIASVVDKLLSLVESVKSSEFSGIQCDDVEGSNWFDLRDGILESA